MSLHIKCDVCGVVLCQDRHRTESNPARQSAWELMTQARCESQSLACADDFLVRPSGGEDETNFVKKTWLRSFSEDAWPAAEFMFGPRFMTEHHVNIERVLDVGAVSVAYRASMPTRICGFAVTEGRDDTRFVHEDTVHFVFVRARWRRMGVAKLLLRPLLDRPAYYTHRTIALRPLTLPKAWTFNPYPFLRTS